MGSTLKEEEEDVHAQQWIERNLVDSHKKLILIGQTKIYLQDMDDWMI